MTLSAAEVAPLTTMASAMFFGGLIFAAAALVASAAIDGSLRELHVVYTQKSSALSVRSFTSVFAFLYNMSILGVILLYAYLGEHHPPFPHSQKSYDRDEFFFLVALLVVISFFTVKRHGDPKTTGSARELSAKKSKPINCQRGDILNRDQTEEWKGWMQFVFLLYHYFHADEVYNAIRVMITAYVWMTGFNNFSFFYLKGDCSIVRVLQMLWRLNFLVVCLCLTQGTTYILYYICLLHSYYFLMVYAAMRVAMHVNYSHAIRHKLAILAVVIYAVWDLDNGIFAITHRLFLGEIPMTGATSGSLWEWYFRSSLDHWSTLLGMVFALNFPITELLFRKIESQALLHHIAAKSAMAFVFAASVVLWSVGPFQYATHDYNRTNAYVAWIPIYAYIYFRNLTPWLRCHTLELLHQMGKATLETYLMHHHIWLTSDAKTLLTLVPGWPKMNFLVVSIIYVVVSRRLYYLTLYLRGMILPNDLQECWRNLAVLFVLMLGFLGIASILRAVGLLSLTSVLMVASGVGFLLHRVIVASTMQSRSSRDDLCTRQLAGNVGSIGPACGLLTLLALGFVWHLSAANGASKIKLLPATCQRYVNKGIWIPTDGCDKAALGRAHRFFGVSSFGTCLPQSSSFVWGWNSAPSSSHCQFSHRTPDEILKSLNRRRILFVGDSIIRHLYHATCRQMGDTHAGAYNTTMGKWSDFSRTYGGAEVVFKWAPFADGELEVLRNISSGASKPDLVVVGGGSWDRLHRFTNETELRARQKEIRGLVEALSRLRSSGVPTTWVTPTAINTWGLLTDEKRENIREDQMAELRQMYEEFGVTAEASFVLDGPSFTVDRVDESYDGVHYPLQVYDAAAQILLNAMDWLLPQPSIQSPSEAPRPGAMASPVLGLLVLALVFVGIYTMDGFLGISYVAVLWAPLPHQLSAEAFAALHFRMGLRQLDFPSFEQHGEQASVVQMDKSKSSDSDDEESKQLLVEEEDDAVDV